MMVDFGEIESAYQFVSSGTRYEHQAFLSRETGEIFFSSEMGESDELPDDVDSERYVAIPDKWDLDLGEPLVMEFVARHLPEGLDAVHAMFRKRGAYARFKAFLDERDLLQYALMGASYARNGLDLPRPRIGLLNVGTARSSPRRSWR